MNERRRSRRVAYGLAVLAPAVTLLVRWPLAAVLGDRVLYMTFFPAVLIVAYVGGFWPGLLATVLSALAATYFLVAPLYSLEIASVHDALALSLLVLVGTIISGLSESLHRARRRIVADERRRAEEARRETEGRFSQLAEHIHEIFWMSDVRGEQLFYVSPGYEEVWGRTRQALYEDPRSWVESIHPDDRERAIEHMGQHRHGVFTDGEFRVVRPDGSVRWVRSRAFPIKDQNGAVSRIAGLAEDITGRKQIEEDVRVANARVDLAVRGSNIGVWEIDLPDGDYRPGHGYHVNIWEQLGYTRPDSPTDHATGMVMIHPDDRAPLEAAVRSYLAGETGEFEVENWVRHKDGSYRWMLTRGAAVRDAGGKPIRFVGIVVDITDRKRAEDALRESEERFRGTFENAAVGIAHADAAGRFLRVNEKFCAIVGYPREELLHRTVQDITHPDDLAASIEPYTATLSGESPGFRLENRYLHKDGSLVWVELFASLQRDAAGRPVYTIVIIQDVSERKRLEAELSQAHARLNLAVCGSNITIWEIDMPDGGLETGRIAVIDSREPLAPGRPEAQVDFATAMAVVHPGDRDPVERAMKAYLSGETREYEIEYRVRHDDGTDRWVLTRGVAVRDAAGTPIRFTGSSVDITDLKRAEENLRESEHRWRSLTEALPQLVWTATPDGACDYFSTQWTQYTGVPASHLLAWRWLDVLHPDDREATRQFWTNSVAGHGTYDVEYRVRRADGEYRWFKTRGVPIRDSEGSIFKWFGTCTDITDGKLAAEELRLAKEAAESANRAKDEFLANVSHEIRTPMNAILGMTELALDTPLTEDQRQCLKTVKSAADNLLGIINDLLDFAKIEAGKLALDPADFSLRAALGDTLRALATRAHQKGLELVCHIDPDVPDALVGDTGRLRQVLLNLVGNAIKFTPAGEVVVRAEAAADPPGGGEAGVRIAVTDTGIGIPLETQDRIFRAFEQEDTSTTRKYGGTGLGLSIAARLVALMGGRITVDSRPGRGSTFAFTARFGRQPHPADPPPAPAPVQLRGLRVLVVDDNATNRRILEGWLRGWQMDPRAVGDGVAAAGALWHAVTQGRPYPLVLLDARMPDTDGLALAARIREWPALAATRIILLTSGDRPGDLPRFRELRVDAHLLKPVQQEELLATIYRVMYRADEMPAPPAVAPEPAPAARPMHVLVAEDSGFSAHLMEQLLVRRGHRVQLAGDGRAALALAGEGGFDLLLLDVHMPEMDGFQVIRAIREREAAAGGHLPVIALTARSRAEDRERCLAAGMDDFLTKPVRVPDLLAAMARVTRVTRGTRPPDAADRGVLTPTVVLATCEDDAGLLRKLCGWFRDRVPDHLAALSAACSAGDLGGIREAAHKLAAMLAVFSTPAGELASEVEDRAAAGDLGAAADLAARLRAAVTSLLPLIDGLSLERLHALAGQDPHRG
ncbi:MAG: domain S-box protein [Gemmataceae bacterium]|nr:domain S-box protein [Gemmataceae bacterium]